MKKHFMIMPLLALFIFGCSSPDEKVEFDNETLVSESFLEKTDFNNIRNQVSKMASSKNSNNNGVMFFEKAGAFSNFLGFFNFPELILIYKLNDEGNPDPLIDVKVFDDNKAQFSANIRDPYVEVSNLITGEILYSNLCNEKKTGHLHINWTAPYSVIDFGFGPLFMSGDPMESSTPNNLQLSVKIDDGFVLTNPDTGEGDCTEVSSETNLKIISIGRDNNMGQTGGRLFKIIGL